MRSPEHATYPCPTCGEPVPRWGLSQAIVATFAFLLLASILVGAGFVVGNVMASVPK